MICARILIENHMYTSYVLLVLAGICGVGGLIYFLLSTRVWGIVWRKITRLRKAQWIALASIAAAVVMYVVAVTPYPVTFAMPPMMHSFAPAGLPASIPINKIVEFFLAAQKFEHVSDIGADPSAVPAPITRTENETVKIELTAKEVLAEVAPGITFNYWTYNGQVPGPMLRVKEGDRVELTLRNDPTSLHPHNIDLHAVTGPGGGASVTVVNPGESKTFTWKALNPGLYVYHCANPNVSTHNSHGQYGMILVEPKNGLPAVDKEFYVMQGELYTMGGLGKKGLVPFDSQALLDGNPTYITMNGRVETDPRMTIQRGEKVRIYVGNGGVNVISSFHAIGEIFDIVYPEAAIGEGSTIYKNVQTTAVLPGGAAIVEFTAEVPGKLLLVDHALARMNKGAWAAILVTGEANPEVFSSSSSALEHRE